jgi:hypothetical protein
MRKPQKNYGISVRDPPENHKKTTEFLSVIHEKTTKKSQENGLTTVTQIAAAKLLALLFA